MLKKIIKNLTPPLLLKILNLMFQEKPNDLFEFEEGNYNRTSLILRAIASKNLDDCLYLEIGVFKNKVFNCIPLKKNNKIGVDPELGGTHRMTSDEFFQTNKLKFDVIFIDGLHHYDQAQRDLINSLKFLKKNGVILIHDMLPRNPLEERVPQKQPSWTGDVWKLGVELLKSETNFIIANIDHGVGIIKPLNKNKYITLNDELNDKRFQTFQNFLPKFPIVSLEESFKFIDN